MSTPSYAPFVVVPPLTCCEHAYIVYGQGSPPYSLNVIATGDANGSSLEALPLQHHEGVFRWRVDFNEGANVTFALTDGNGQQAYSQYRVVQAGEETTCSKTVYKSSHSSASVGAIVGGVLGALALLCAFFAFLWWRRRQLKKQRGVDLSGGVGGRDSKEPSLADDDVRLASGAAGVTRAGTFNLGNVRFTEASLDHLRAIDHPPGYNDEAAGERDPPPPISEARRARRRAAQEERDRQVAERLASQEEEDVAETTGSSSGRAERTDV
ncbi:hypothetical protein JCM10207_005027 [Rhodosporidiobolus poonsookiae]